MRKQMRQKFEAFNRRRKLRARLLAAPAYSHQLLDRWWSVLRSQN